MLADIGLSIGSCIVRELVRMHPDIIRVGIFRKLDGFDGGSPEQHGLGDAVHAVHDATVGRENNGKAQIRCFYQADMLDHASPHWGGLVRGAEWLVQLSDRSQGDVNARKVFGPPDEPINIPR